MIKKELQELLDGIKAECAALGVRKGDILYVASDVTQLLSLANQKAGILPREERDGFLDRLTAVCQELIGEEGTLLFPVFTWTFCAGTPFDLQRTPGQVGAWNNWILQHRPDFRRTRHPLYSFMVWGRRANELLALDNQESFGKDSPFAWLHNNGGKILFFSVSVQRGLTYMHYVEQETDVPYRYRKYFIGKYTDADRNESVRCYSMYVRDMRVALEENLPDEAFEARQLICCREYQGMKFRLMPDLSKVYSFLREDLLRNGGQCCYRFENYRPDWERGPTHKPEVSMNGQIV